MCALPPAATQLWLCLQVPTLHTHSHSPPTVPGRRHTAGWHRHTVGARSSHVKFQTGPIPRGQKVGHFTLERGGLPSKGTYPRSSPWSPQDKEIAIPTRQNLKVYRAALTGFSHMSHADNLALSRLPHWNKGGCGASDGPGPAGWSSSSHVLSMTSLDTHLHTLPHACRFPLMLTCSRPHPCSHASVFPCAFCAPAHISVSQTGQQHFHAISMLGA